MRHATLWTQEINKYKVFLCNKLQPTQAENNTFTMLCLLILWFTWQVGKLSTFSELPQVRSPGTPELPSLTQSSAPETLISVVWRSHLGRNLLPHSFGWLAESVSVQLQDRGFWVLLPTGWRQPTDPSPHAIHNMCMRSLSGEPAREPPSPSPAAMASDRTNNHDRHPITFDDASYNQATGPISTPGPGPLGHHRACPPGWVFPLPPHSFQQATKCFFSQPAHHSLNPLPHHQRLFPISTRGLHEAGSVLSIFANFWEFICRALCSRQTAVKAEVHLKLCWHCQTVSKTALPPTPPSLTQWHMGPLIPSSQRDFPLSQRNLTAFSKRAFFTSSWRLAARWLRLALR